MNVGHLAHSSTYAVSGLRNDLESDAIININLTIKMRMEDLALGWVISVHL